MEVKIIAIARCPDKIDIARRHSIESGFELIVDVHFTNQAIRLYLKNILSPGLRCRYRIVLAGREHEYRYKSKQNKNIVFHTYKTLGLMYLINHGFRGKLQGNKGEND
jgi:hypothetical protein